MNFKANSKVLIQGLAEPLGKAHSQLMKAYGTQIDDLPVFDRVEQALKRFGCGDRCLVEIRHSKPLVSTSDYSL